MPPVEPSSHLTSAVTVRSAIFGSDFLSVWATCSHTDEVDPHAPLIAAMSVIGDRFARYLPPNFCVQLASSFGVRHKELALFLHPAMRNSLTMCHVFKMTLQFRSRSEATDSAENLIVLFSAMRSKLTYLTRINISLDAGYEHLFGKRCPTLRAALLGALPSRLQAVHISLSNPHVGLHIDADDLRTTLAALPHLRELRLIGYAQVLASSGITELLRPDRPVDAQQQQLLFFPALQRLEAHVSCRSNYMRFLTVASQSVVVSQLHEEFALRCYDRGDVDVALLAETVLPKLSHIRAIGDSFLATDLQLSGPLDLSSLRGCKKIGNRFLERVDFGGITLDLSVLTGLEELGSHFLCESKNINNLLLPPNLRRIVGGYFCAQTHITALDFSRVSHSLESIDLTFFAYMSPMVKFDTSSSFADARIDGCARGFFHRCVSLVEIDLGGFERGLVEAAIGNSFLSGCTALVTVRGMRGLAGVKRVGKFFMHSTSHLADCDFAQMSSLLVAEDEPLLLLHGSALKSKSKILVRIMDANQSGKQLVQVEGEEEEKKDAEDDFRLFDDY